MLRRLSLATVLYLSFFGTLVIIAANRQNNLDYDIFIAKAEATSAAYVSQLAVNNDITPETGTPTRLRIVSRRIDIRVLPGQYDPASQQWTLTNTNIHFSNSSDIATNTTGNTFLYGHNTDNVLGNTVNLEENDILEIITDNNKLFAYRYVSDKVVDPTDVSVLNYDGQTPRLTLMSCTGSWNESRRAMFFEFVSVRDL